MAKVNFVWNLTKTRCVKASLIKEFFVQNFPNHCVIAYLSPNDTVVLYEGKNYDDSVQWLDKFIKELREES